MSTSVGHEDNELPLSVVITVVSGKEALRRCLGSLAGQMESIGGEIIVPYDEWSGGVAELADEFRLVRFLRIDDLGIAGRATVSARAHRLFDRRRACGLAAVRGRIVALTEDHAVPASDWCEQILLAHRQEWGVIGGRIENAVDRAMNWAWYYCDFGRYGSPVAAGPTDNVSDVNVSYKRDVVESVREIWKDAYHETTVHWALQARGTKLFLDPHLVVYQHRPMTSLRSAIRERAQWGRIFAETRVRACGAWRRLIYAFGSPILPALLTFRVLGHMIRQGRSAVQILKSLPLVAVFEMGWSWGEFVGYVSRPIPEGAQAASVAASHR